MGGVPLPNVARYQLRHTPMSEKYSIFRSISVSGQACGQTAFIEDFAREFSAEKVSVYKGFSSMFARAFKDWLFSAKRFFARGGVPAGVLLPKHARYRTAPHHEIQLFNRAMILYQKCFALSTIFLIYLKKVFAKNRKHLLLGLFLIKIEFNHNRSMV